MEESLNYFQVTIHKQEYLQTIGFQHKYIQNVELQELRMGKSGGGDNHFRF